MRRKIPSEQQVKAMLEKQLLYFYSIAKYLYLLFPNKYILHLSIKRIRPPIRNIYKYLSQYYHVNKMNTECEYEVYFPDGMRSEKYCCGAIKSVKERCLRVHDNDEAKCIDFIKGHEECKVIKRQYESKFKSTQS